MITVKLFARIREELGVAELRWPLESSVYELIAALAREQGSRWSDELLKPKVIVAINHQVSSRDSAIADGDEVAFFPPVTGG
jgi:molybdopterin synthase sulfur carrier subunit